MTSIFETMLKRYSPKSNLDKKNAVKEIMQEIVLCGLSRAGFFDKAAFYGGTALRIFYGLDRFSEDLDFSLVAPDENFKLEQYFPSLENEVRAFGLNVTIAEKEKTVSSNVQSAFLKGNTREHLLMFFAPNEVSGIAANETIKIKFEVDVTPPPFATFERQFRLLPAAYEVNLYDMPSLFAGKIHAVLCRNWQTRVKGRDLYDFVFYLSRGTSVNIPHLQARLLQSGIDENLDVDKLKQLLCEKFDAIDYAAAKADVLPFVKDVKSVELWSAEFFKNITNTLLK